MAGSLTQDGETIQASKSLSSTLVHLREQIADSATWRALVALPLSTWADVADKADVDDASRPNALAAIHVGRFIGNQPGAGSEVARICLRAFDEMSTDWTSYDSWDVQADVYMNVQIPIPTDYRSDSRVGLAEIDFLNKIGNILQEVKLAGDGVGDRIAQPEFQQLNLPGEILPDHNAARRIRRYVFAVRTRGVGR